MSEAPKFKKLFFFCFFFSNLLISMIWTIFLDIMDSLLIKYDMMIFFSGFSSGFWIFSGYFRIFVKFSDFIGFGKNDTMISIYGLFLIFIRFPNFPNLLRIFRIFLIFPDFFRFSEFKDFLI